LELQVKKFTVIAKYPGGINRTYDLALFEIAKHVVGGSGIGGGGCDLRTGTRDNDWGVDTQEDADLLKQLLLQAKIPGLEVKVM
jgi:hypothetical protein